MYKKLVLSSFLGILLVCNIGCGKKPTVNHAAQETAAASAPTTVQHADMASIEFAPAVNKQEAGQFLSQLRTNFPLIRVSKLDNAPIPGFYQVTAEGDIFYMTTNGQYMLVGDVIGVSKDNKVNLTEEVRKTNRVALLNSVNESDMVVFTPKGKVEHLVTVFTDVDCGYCRKFHQEIQSYLDKGIKVRYMSFPRAGKGSDSYNKAVSVWCAADRNTAMNQAKLTNDFKANPTLCDASKIVDASMDMVRKLGLNGTPALIFEDGTMVPGYMPADRLKAALDMNAKKKESALSGSVKEPHAG